MLDKRDLMCIRHCNKTIFSYVVLPHCPMCGRALGENLNEIPFTLPCPFVRACQNPCSIVLRPSVGDFLCSFQKYNNLHIGLTSSNGTIVEFDVDGLAKTPPNCALKNESWDQCLVIAHVPQSWYDRWDEVLEQMSCEQLWNREMYQEENHNCYAFVLSFLKLLDYREFSEFCTDKLSFSEKIVASKTQIAAKYITVHRKLQKCSYFIEDRAST